MCLFCAYSDSHFSLCPSCTHKNLEFFKCAYCVPNLDSVIFDVPFMYLRELRFSQSIYYVAFENFEIQLATQKNLVVFMCAFFVLLCGLSIFF